MAPATAQQRKIPVAPLVIGAVILVALIAALIYLNRPVPKVVERPASTEAKAYLPNLALSDVSMKAAENFMKQQVVEIDGSIQNKGKRALGSVEVYCLFSGADGREVYRERVPIVPPKGSPLEPGETRHFRLPFDTLPDTWNQAMPRMVIAQITFAQ